MSGPNKSLGQHWLKDREILETIASSAELTIRDTVLEIGPGLGTLTSVLLSQAGRVVAVEFDPELARKLPAQFPGKDLTVINKDILSFDFRQLPAGYKVVANVPYYITSAIVRVLSEATNPPSLVVLLVQKEVAERLAAEPGEMSLMSVAAQIYHQVSLGPVVPAEYFTPPPKVDSQVVIMRRRLRPLVETEMQNKLFRIVKIGFAAKRKKLAGTLAGGLSISKPAATKLLVRAGVSADARPQDLTIDDWVKITEQLN